MDLKFEKLFKAIDASDTNEILSFLTEDAEFKFGNLDSVMGKQNIGPFLHGFFGSIDHTNHSGINEYQMGNILFSTGMVEYTRKDGSKLTVPFCNKFELDGNDLIRKYEIFVDNSELYKN